METVIGSDEVGYGAVAGPLYVVGVAMPRSWRLPGLRDSKKLTKAAREALFEPILEQVRGNWELAVFTPEQIDLLGVHHCLVKAHTLVLQRLLARTAGTTTVIVDGNMRLPEIPQAKAIPKADDIFPVVSAASVIAKVLRDEVMMVLSSTYPFYGFERHVGYGTEAHYKAMKKHGLCPVHRRSYLKKIIAPSP